MIWMKVAGTVLLFACGTGIGLYSLTFLQKRINFYEEMERFFTLIAEEVNARSQPVAQLLEASYMRYPFAALQMKGRLPVFPPCCSAKEIHLLSLAFSQLGCRCREDTLADLEYYRFYCRDSADLAREKMQTAKKLYVPLGVSGGGALAVLLL